MKLRCAIEYRLVVLFLKIGSFELNINTCSNIFSSFQPLIIILGDSRNYMPLILVPSSAKRIAIKILVIAKLNEKKILFWESLFVISFIPAKNYLLKVSNLSTRTICQSKKFFFFFLINFWFYFYQIYKRNC